MKSNEDISINLVLKNNNLYFKAGEPINIPIQADCKNIEYLKDIKYNWTLYMDGQEKCVKNTSTGAVLITIHPMYAGHRFQLVLNLTANEQISCTESDEVYIKWNNNEFAPFSANGNIEFTPTCEKEVIAIEWCDKYMTPFYNKQIEKNKKTDIVEQSFHLYGEKFGAVFCLVELWGYNGNKVVVYRKILGPDKQYEEIVNKRKIVTVTDGNIGISFGRNLLKIGLKSGESREVTAIMIIQDYKTSDIIGDFRYKFKVDGNDKIERMESYPSQPVIVGNYNITENNYMPCKYTQIDVEYTKDKEAKEKQKVTVFKEGSYSKNFVNIIGGKRKASITLSEYTPNKCRLKEKSHKEKKVPFMLYGERKKELPINVSEKKGTIENIELKYKYEDDFFNMISLPTEGIMQTSVLYTGNANCRHSNNVALNMYPDIKWEAFIELCSANTSMYIHQGMPKAYSIFKRHQEKVLEACKGFTDIEISLGLLATYNDGEKVDLSANIAQSVKTVFQALKTIRDALDALSFRKTANENKELEGRDKTPKNSKVPLFLEISSPVLKVGGGWQYDLNSRNQLVRKGEIAISASPLIEAKGGIDLIACAIAIPGAGDIIKAILKINDLAEWTTKVLSNGKAKYEGLIWFNLILQGSIGIEGVFEFSNEEKEIDISTPMNIKFIVELGLSAEVKVETVTISGNESCTVKVGAGGSANTGLTFKPSMGYNTEEGMFLGFDVDFDGITLTINGEAIYEQERKGREKESHGLKIGKDPMPLIGEKSLFKGKVYPFNAKKS